jgi:hypothetical protein
MMVNKSAKFQSQVSMDFEDILLYFIVNLGWKRGIILSKCLIELLPPVYRLGSWWLTSLQSFKPYFNGLWEYLRYYKNLNISGYCDADAEVTIIAILIL